jgi:hypothetical protein
MEPISQPAGGHSPAAEQKLSKVPHGEKTSVVNVFLAVEQKTLVASCGNNIVFAPLKVSAE